jgi:hypothetical protein
MVLDTIDLTTAEADTKVWVEGNEQESTPTESMWAIKTGPDSVVLMNTPFCAYGYAPGDEVTVEYRDNEYDPTHPLPWVVGMKTDSGRCVARVIIDEKHGKLEWVSDILRGDFGLGRESTGGEGANAALFALSYDGKDHVKLTTLLLELKDRGLITNWEIAKGPDA